MENWKSIQSFKDYEISDHGKVRKGTRLLKLGRSFDGYPRASFKKGSSWITKTVHPLVLTAFVCARPKGMDACHIDGNKENNNVSNLRWGTRKENVSDCLKHGTFQRGERHYKTNLTDNDVIEIRARHKRGERNFVLAREYKTTKSALSAIVTGKNWKHLLEGRF